MAEREPWEDELVEGLVKAGQDNFSAADSEEAMENIAEPIAKAIKHGGSSGQQQSDWNETDPSKVPFIKNKPNIPSDIPSRQEMAAAIGVETSRATEAEASLQTQINDKASQSALEAETERAEAAESALDTRLTTAESEIDSLESSVEGKEDEFSITYIEATHTLKWSKAFIKMIVDRILSEGGDELVTEGGDSVLLEA